MMLSNGVVRNIFCNLLRCRAQDVSCRLLATKLPKSRARLEVANTQFVRKELASIEAPEIVEKDAPVKMDNPFGKEKPKCLLCRLNIQPDYKNVRFLSQFQSRYTGRIYERHITGLCRHKQAAVEKEIAKAQYAGLMGFFTRDIRYSYDPPLFDSSHPFRPHKY